MFNEHFSQLKLSMVQVKPGLHGLVFILGQPSLVGNGLRRVVVWFGLVWISSLSLSFGLDSLIQ